MSNVDTARRLIDRLAAEGVRDVCVCAGSRNAPLLAVLGASDLRLYSFVDERSAAFFAVGRIKRDRRPVAVVTTSGTAVAEMHAAAIEAFYSGLPLVLISADRPERFRSTGAPQSIDQIRIFGPHAETSLDGWSRRGPLHLNIEFDEPLIDGGIDPLHVVAGSAPPGSMADEAEAEIAFERPLVIVGALSAESRPQVREFIGKLGAPAYAEALSGLREDAELPHITSGERMITRGTFDSVIRIGGVPTLRYWRDLETLRLPVAHFTDTRFPGLTYGDVHSISALPRNPASRARSAAFFEEDRERAAAFSKILLDEPTSELAMLRRLSLELPHGARVYLGNSLPVREWDLVATRADRGFSYEANRGANGIDGQISTFFGQCEPARQNVAVIGDLTAIHDLGAPWIVRQLEDLSYRIVIVNNGGGRIFGRVSSLRSMARDVRERIVENDHPFRFDAWAAMWGIEGRLTELRPDADASQRAWQRYDALWA